MTATTTDADRVIITETFPLEDDTAGTAYLFTYRGTQYRAEQWWTRHESGLDYYDEATSKPVDLFAESDDAAADYDSHTPFEFALDRFEAFWAIEHDRAEVLAAQAALRAAEARVMHLAAGDAPQPTPEAVLAVYAARAQRDIERRNVDVSAFATDEERFGPQDGEHVFLVAVSVTTSGTREAAEDALITEMSSTIHLTAADVPYVESWWVAEDERHDGSDNDSAVFVHPGRQPEANLLLRQAGLAR